MSDKNFNIDDFFKKHFDDLGEPKKSELKQKQMIENVLMKAREKSENKKQKNNLLDFVKEYFSGFKISPLRYAIPLLAILLFSIFFFINKNIEHNNTKIAENKAKTETESTSQADSLHKQKATDIDKTLDTPKISDNKNNQKKAIPKIKISESDFALINYDFSTRSLENDKTNPDNQAQQVLVEYLNKNNIKYNIKDDLILTEWFTYQKISTQLSIKIQKDTKDLQLQVAQKDASKEQITETLDHFRKNIYDIIIENMFLSE